MDVKEFYQNFAAGMGKVKAEAAPMMEGFSGFFDKVMSEGKLTVKQKEFVALGIAVAKKCEPCIMLHVKKCLEAGATRGEIIEAASVAVVMEGGPAYAHMTIVVEALDELSPA